MRHKYGLEAFDRTCRDIMGQVNPLFADIPFGNKLVVLGGDFRQVLPVVKKGSRKSTVLASINESVLWNSVKTLKLTINMRIRGMLETDSIAAQEFSDLLLNIGNGNLPSIK